MGNAIAKGLFIAPKRRVAPVNGRSKNGVLNRTLSIITTSRKLTSQHIGDLPFSQSQQAYKKNDDPSGSNQIKI